MTQLEADIKLRFKEAFGKTPFIVRSPGRINLIGEHTDYNDGFVMPAAIDKAIVFAMSASDEGKARVMSVKYNQQIEIDLDNPTKIASPAWANYLLGVLFQLKQRGLVIKPFNCVFGGEVPMGAGLSSSAAMECGFGYALIELNQLNVPKIDLVKMAQWAEHHYVGVKCGIMDQFASVMGKAGHVILLDCRSLEYRYVPIDLTEYTIVLCDTKVKHSLVDSEYNTRRSECETGVSILKKYYPQIVSLRDVNYQMLIDHKSELPGKVYNRCLYVVQEIARVQEASKDLDNGRLEAFGKKMYETHDGLSKLYEVSCKELDFLAEEAKQFKDVLGARMMGGGFGGCTINIVRKGFAEKFDAHMKKVYHEKFGMDMPTYHVNIRQGTSLIHSEHASVL